MSVEQPSLETLTLLQLRKVASEYGIHNYSRMRKAELIEAIRTIEAQSGQLPAPSVTASTMAAQAQVEASKPPDRLPLAALGSVDEGLAEIPDGYGESRIVLIPRDPQWAYTYWDIPHDHRESLRQQGGERLALRFYDVTDIDLSYQTPHSLQQYECDEMSREWYLPIPVSDRDYVAEIGYLCNDGRWLLLARSLPAHIPSVYPSDWVEDYVMTVGWEQDLRGKTLMTLPSSGTRSRVHDSIFSMAQSGAAQRMAGSLFGSMQHVPGSVVSSFAVPISSYVFPSGVGMWALPTVSGLTMSGVGLSASMPPLRPRKFWLIADAELIVYGATEPDATVTISGNPIPLNPDGTFRFQVPFPDGPQDYPIFAVAADGEQTRAIHMTFTRHSPRWAANSKEIADDFKQLIFIGSEITFKQWLTKFKVKAKDQLFLRGFHEKAKNFFNDFEKIQDISPANKQRIEDLAREIMNNEKIQMALYGKLVECDGISQSIEALHINDENISKAIWLVADTICKSLQLKRDKAPDRKSLSSDEFAFSVAYILKTLQKQDGHNILRNGYQSRLSEKYKRTDYDINDRLDKNRRSTKQWGVRTFRID